MPDSDPRVAVLCRKKRQPLRQLSIELSQCMLQLARDAALASPPRLAVLLRALDDRDGVIIQHPDQVESREQLQAKCARMQ